jgi:uncharacterized protein YoaH (UPF0181 family)
MARPTKTKREKKILAEAQKIRESIAASPWEDKTKRIDRIHSLVAEGWSRKLIIKTVAEEFKVCLRTVRDDYKEAEIQRAPQREEELLQLQERSAFVFEQLRFEAQKDKRWSDAIAAHNGWCRVMGSFAPKKVQIQADVNATLHVQVQHYVRHMTPQELEALRVVNAGLLRIRAAGLLVAKTDEEERKEPGT